MRLVTETPMHGLLRLRVVCGPVCHFAVASRCGAPPTNDDDDAKKAPKNYRSLVPDWPCRHRADAKRHSSAKINERRMLFPNEWRPDDSHSIVPVYDDGQRSDNVLFYVSWSVMSFTNCPELIYRHLNCT